MEPLDRTRAKELLNSRRKTVERNVMLLRMENPDDRHRLPFLYAAANRYNIIPFRTGSDAAFFKRVIYHERMALEERKLLAQLAPLIELKGMENIRKQENRGIVFCSFHVGSFFSPLYLFVSQNIDVTVCIASVAYKQLRTSIEKDIRRLTGSGIGNGSVTLLDIGSPAATMKMLRILKNGGNLLLYVDVAYGDTPTERDSMVVNMLSGRLLVKKGAARIAHLAGSPIIPLMSGYTANGISLRALRPIIPSANEDSEKFCGRAFTKLFGLLEKALYDNPEQWEGWLYCHKMVVPRRDVADDGGTRRSLTFMLDSGRFYGYTREQKYYLFDKETYRFISIERDAYVSLFENTAKGRIAKNIMDELIDRKVLIRVLK